MVQHLALITTETLPCFKQPCAGGGVRIWGLGEALQRRGLQCTYLISQNAQGTDNLPLNAPIKLFKPELLHQEIQNGNYDAVLFEQWQPMTFLREPIDIPIFVDLPGPLALEYVWRDKENFFQHVVDKVECLSRADYFTCALERQRGYYDAWLTWAGVAPDAQRLAVTPFISHEMPISRQGHAEDEPLFFWGGMFWPWQDRTLAFETILETMSHFRKGQMVVAGVSDKECTGGMDSAYADHPHVSWIGSLNFNEYVTELKRCAVAIDLCKTTEERRLSSDLRTGTALWAGVPCIVSPQSPWADWIKKHNAGWVIAYDAQKQLKALIKEIALERVDIVGKRRGAKVVSTLISDDSHVDQLMKWLENPTKRQPSPSFFDARTREREQRIKEMQQNIDLLQHQKDSLQHDLESIRNNPLFKIYKNIQFWK